MNLVKKALTPLLALSLVGGTAIAASAHTTGAARSATSSSIITIGNEGFTESYIMQDIYSDLLTNAGYRVKDLAQASSTRQEAIPALEAGSIGLVPDYAGSLLVYLNAKDQKQAGTIKTALSTLNTILSKKNLVALPGSAGLDQNVFVVTNATAKADKITSLSQIKSLASGWTFGAPPECSANYFCAPGLKSVYGITFKTIKNFDESGPLTVGALKSGTANIVELFSTDNVIAADHFTVLKDDRGLEPADHLIPVIAKKFATTAIKAVLAKVNPFLTTSVLTTLDAQVSGPDHQTPLLVALGFLRSKNLLQSEQ